MKVTLELEYHASEWTSLNLIKAIKNNGGTVKMFRLKKNIPLQSVQDYYSIGFIKKIVCVATNTPEEVFGLRSRKQEIAENRQIVMYLCRKYTRKSLREIGGEFGRNGATVKHACKAVQDLVHTNKAFRNKLDQIEINLLSKLD